jgi:DNA-binding NtrC family response regulator
LAATNEDLENAIQLKHFRHDLFYRLNVVRIEVPPLRERREDIPLLCRHFLAELNRQFGTMFDGLATETLDVFMDHAWPGNVRELRNTLEAAFALRSDRRSPQLVLPPDLMRRFQAAHARRASLVERDRLIEALERTNWNKRRAAIDLAMSRMTLYRKMRKFAIEPNRKSPRSDGTRAGS